MIALTTVIFPDSSVAQSAPGSLGLDEVQRSMLIAAIKDEVGGCYKEKFELRCDADACTIQIPGELDQSTPVRQFTLRYSFNDLMAAGKTFGVAASSIRGRVIMGYADGRQNVVPGVSVEGSMGSGTLIFASMPLRFLAFDVACDNSTWIIKSLAGPDTQKALASPDLFGRRVLLSGLETAKKRIKR